MIAQAMQWVKNVFDTWARPQMIRAPGEPEHVYWLVHRDRCERVTAEPLPRDYVLRRLQDVVDFVDGHSGGQPAVFVDSDAVTAVLEEANGREVGRMPLECSQHWQTLSALAANRQPRNQRDLVQMLRTQLVDLVDTETIDVFRGLKFDAQQQSEAQVGHTTDSMGKAIRMTVQTSGRGIPEYITVLAKIYANVPEVPAASVRLAVTVDWVQQSILLQPVAPDIQAALLEVQSQLQEWLVARVACGVLQGVPRRKAAASESDES